MKTRERTFRRAACAIKNQPNQIKIFEKPDRLLFGVFLFLHLGCSSVFCFVLECCWLGLFLVDSFIQIYRTPCY
jgi:hypothetical protein